MIFVKGLKGFDFCKGFKGFSAFYNYLNPKTPFLPPQLRSEDVSDSLSEARLDLGLKGEGKSHIFFLNNLEADEMYMCASA